MIDDLINQNKERLKKLIETQKRASMYQRNLNERLEKIKPGGELIKLNFPEEVSEGMVRSKDGTKVDDYLITQIPDNISKWQKEIAVQNHANISNVHSGYPRKRGGNNTKELRQKLNTMSIKQLKRLSDKKYIEYGKKNTIKSLINNYMKHI